MYRMDDKIMALTGPALAFASEEEAADDDDDAYMARTHNLVTVLAMVAAKKKSPFKISLRNIKTGS
jgi:hypothetical protein